MKTPKVYFTDTGLLCYLAGIREARHAAAGPMAGAIAETAAVVEVLKSFWHRGAEPRLYFWRTATGDEVDLLVETPAGLVPLEIKATATPSPAMARGIRKFRETAPAAWTRGFVIHTGTVTLPLGDGIVALPFSNL